MFESLNTAGDSQRWSYNVHVHAYVHVETYGQCITDATAATISIVLNLKPIFASDSFYTRSVVRMSFDTRNILEVREQAIQSNHKLCIIVVLR